MTVPARIRELRVSEGLHAAEAQLPFRTPPWIRRAWRWMDPARRRTAAATTVAAASGLLLSAVMPRGPVTTAEAVAAMITGLVAGLASGLLLRSRWAMLLAPVVHIGVFELVRVPTDGPLVDGVHLGTSWGIAAFVLGRVFDGLLVVLPMLLGAAYGAGLARRLNGSGRSAGRLHTRIARGLRRLVAGSVALALVAFGVVLTRPASTPAILGPDGQPVAGSIATLEKLELGGHDQWISIRGHDTDNPVLLHLAGGPGQSDLGYIRALWGGIESDFTVVDWDQRGTGKSYAALDPTSTWTLDQAVADTVQLTNYLRQRFDERKIYLIGESWGTIIGTLAVQQHPELYYAYIGGGQMVDVLETDRLLYQAMLDYASRTGNQDVADRMRSYGPPPYDDVFANAYVLSYYDELNPHDPPQSYEDRISDAGIGPLNVLASEYTFIEKVNVVRGLADMFAVMYPQLQGIDFRRDVPRLHVPVYLLDARYEATARRLPAHEWFNLLKAPIKKQYVFRLSGHSAQYEQADRLHHILTHTVLPQTYDPQ